MDPQAVLKSALVALECIGTGRDERNDAREMAVEALESLAKWLRKGGYPPAVYISRNPQTLWDAMDGATLTKTPTPLCILVKP